MRNTLKIILLSLLLFAGSAVAVDYSLPDDIGANGAFNDTNNAECSPIDSPTPFCNSSLNLGNNDTVTLTQNVTLDINGDMTLGNNVIIDDNGFTLTINLNGNLTVGNNANLEVEWDDINGNVSVGNNGTFTGNFDVNGNVDLGNNNTVNGNITSGGNLDLGNGTNVNGNCTPAPQGAGTCGGGGGGGGAGNTLVLSPQGTETLGGLTFRDDDIVEYDIDSSTSTLLFDGSVLLTDLPGDDDIDAVHYLPSGNIIISTLNDGDLGGLSFGDDDLVEYDPNTDTATLYFDGGNLFSSTDENIDGVYVLANGNILISTTGGANLGGLTFEDGDIVEYNPTADTATLYFDEDLFSGDEDIDGLHVLASGNILITTTGGATLGGLTFEDGDVIEYDPTADTATLYFDEDDFTDGADIVAVSVRGPGVMANPTVNSQTTSDTTPIITGTFSSAFADILTVQVSGVNTYTLGTDSELTSSGDDWTLDLSGITPLVLGTYQVVATSTDTSEGTTLSDNTIDELIIVAPSENLILSTLDDETLAGLSFQDDDLVEYDIDSTTATLLFNGGALFSNTSEDINAVHYLADGTIVLSTLGDANLGGQAFEDEDLVLYNPATNSGSLYLNGDNVFAGEEDISAVYVLDSGIIVLSTTDDATIDGLSFEDEDLIAYDPVSGNASIYLNGDAVFVDEEDIDGVHILDNGNILLSTEDTATINGFTFEDGDVVEYNPATNTATLYFDEDDFSNDADVNALSLLDLGTDPPLVCDVFRDEFTLQAFDNNDGDQNFSGAWDVFEGTSLTTPESSPSASSGKVSINAGRLVITNAPSESPNAPGVERELDLSGYVSAFFTFDYETDNAVDADDRFVIQASSDGGSNWTVLETITGLNDRTGTKSYNLTPFISNQTKIRLRVDTTINSGACCYGATDETMFIDNVQVEACSANTNTLTNFAINVGSGIANACSAFPVTITAQDSSNNPVTDYAGTVSITTSTSNGSFADGTPVPTNALNPDPDNDDNGSVGYTFDPADNGVIGLTLDNPRVETLTITVEDATASVTTTSSDISFVDAGFRIEDSIDVNGLNTDEVVAGRNHFIRITAVRLDPDPNPGVTNCGVAAGYDGSKDVTLWRTPDGDEPAGVNLPVLGGVTLNNTEPGSTSSITFNNGIADLTLATTDVGKFTINIADRTRLFDTERDMVSVATPLTVRPYGFAITSIQETAAPNDPNPDPAATTPTGTIFTTAGSEFSATVTGVLWDSTTDSDNNGLIDAGESYNDNVANPTPRYAWDTVLDTVTGGFYPAGADTDFYRDTNQIVTLALAEFGSGATTVTDLRYGEVGSFTLKGDATDFLNSSGISVTSDEIVVGRFIPASFQISSVVDGVLRNGSSTFTNFGQDFSYLTEPSFVVTAFNALPTPGPTSNYTGAWAKLTGSSFNINQVTQDASNNGSDGNPLAVYHNQADAVITSDNGDGSFAVEFGNDIFCYGTDNDIATGTPGPLGCTKTGNSEVDPITTTDIDLTLATIVDGDSVSSTVNQLFEPTGNEMRFGRIVVSNSFGSELLPQTVELKSQYFENGSYRTNDQDSFTTFDATLDVDLASTGVFTAPLTAANLGVSGNGTFSGGLGSFSLHDDINVTAGPGVTGDVTYAYNVPSWLQYDWASDGNFDGVFDDDPLSKATFGIYSGNEVLIYQQQRYQ